MSDVRFLPYLILLITPLSLPAAQKVAVLPTGPQAGHYLTWRQKPVLLIGDSVTQGWMECGTNFHQTAYIDALAARGINLLMLWAFKGTRAELQQEDRRIAYDAPELWPWAGSPEDRSFDLRRFNPAYFDRLKQLVAYAESQGIVVLITVHDGWPKTCFGGHPFNRALGNGPLGDRRQYVALADYEREMPEAFNPAWEWKQQNQYFQERFCARLITELEPFSNVLIEMFNEGEWYDREQRRRHEQHFLAFFRARGSNLLLSNSDHIAGDAPHREANLDVVTLHPKDWVGHFPKFAAGFHAAPPKPYLYSEPVPEFDGETPSLEQVRRSMWETALAGAGWVNQNDTSFGWDPRAAIARQAAARDRAYEAAGHCARFFNRSGVRFWEMAPAAELSSTGVCLARPGKEYVLYAAAGGEFTVDLSVAPKAQFTVRWYDPRTGRFHSAPAVAGGRGSETFAPPFAGDAVLHLRRVGARPAVAVFPGRSWETRSPEAAGLAGGPLDEFARQVGGDGCIVKDGFLVKTWGNFTQHKDWASAAKPVLSTLLLAAVADGRLASVDALVKDCGWALSPKDSAMTFLHLANMVSGYGCTEAPGQAWGYNDYAIQLYAKSLERIFGRSLDETFRARFAALQFEDGEIFGSRNGLGVVASPRDFARLGWLWLNRGRWAGTALLPSSLWKACIQPQVPADLPRTQGRGDDDLKIGSYGGGTDQTPHGPGVYGFNFWFNEPTGPAGQRVWPALPADAYQANGMWNRDTVTVISSLHLVIAVRGAQLGAFEPGRPDGAANRKFQLLMDALPKQAP